MRHFNTKDEISADDSEATSQFALRRKAMRFVGLSSLMAAFPLSGAETDSSPSLRNSIRALLFDVFGTVVDWRALSSERVDCSHSRRTYRSTGENLRTAGVQATDPQ